MLKDILKYRKNNFLNMPIDFFIKKIESEIDEIKSAIHGNNDEPVKNEIGDLIVAIVGLCIELDINPDDAAAAGLKKIKSRVEELKQISKPGTEEWDLIANNPFPNNIVWQSVKTKLI